MNICIRPKEINVSHYGEKCIKTYFQDVTKKVLCSYKSFQKQPPEVLQKKVLKNVAKSTGKHLCQSLRPEACNFIKKGTLAHVFSCEFCEISKNNIIFTEQLWTTASASYLQYVPILPSVSYLLLPFLLSHFFFISFALIRETVLYFPNF